MPKVKLHFHIGGWVNQTVEVPQSVIDEYKRQVDSGDPDCEAIDRMLADHVRYEDILDQLDDPEEIELTEIKERAELAR